MEKEDPNLITVFICFLRSGLRFTRYDTNNVGLAFIEEIKKHNPNFKPIKVQQRERDQIYTVNAYPKEFEQLILSLIEEYRIKHKLEYRLKKPRKGGGGYNRGGGNRQGGYNQNRGNRDSGGYTRPRRDDQGGGYQRRESDGNRDSGNRPRRNYDDQQGQGGYKPRGNREEYQDRDKGGYRQGNEQRGNRDGYSPNRYSKDREDNNESKRPRRPRRDFNE
ncbi:MAG: hypothetical protein KAI29_31605 [Cyclobacteriaceae bacterium]|nr:hypothetical protein [Cyclobacteriaceae bacterium]